MRPQREPCEALEGSMRSIACESKLVEDPLRSLYGSFSALIGVLAGGCIEETLSQR